MTGTAGSKTRESEDREIIPPPETQISYGNNPHGVWATLPSELPDKIVHTRPADEVGLKLACGRVDVNNRSMLKSETLIVPATDHNNNIAQLAFELFDTLAKQKSASQT